MRLDEHYPSSIFGPDTAVESFCVCSHVIYHFFDSHNGTVFADATGLEILVQLRIVHRGEPPQLLYVSRPDALHYYAFAAATAVPLRRSAIEQASGNSSGWAITSGVGKSGFPGDHNSMLSVFSL